MISRPQTLVDLQPGQTERLGASVRDGGVNFCVFAPRAQALELCLFDAAGSAETARGRMHGPVDGLWHGFLPGAAPGLLYGYRAHGRWAPDEGQRYNPHKLLLDPAATEIVGRFAWRPEHHAYTLRSGDGDHPDAQRPNDHRHFDARDNAAFALKARVPAPATVAPGALNRPRVAAAERVLYEVHVRGFSRAHPAIPEALRGRFAALAHPAAIAHFKALGVTTLSLLPVQLHLDEPLLPPGLVNYWGYNTLGFFAADPRLSLAPDDPAAVNEEFRQMVATLHAHGLEVVLDVVYNHTPEGNEWGPSISFRGLDQQAWYHLDDDGRPQNWSHCGNTLNIAEPQVARFVLDSLRHWVLQMGVDGFRFDLAPVLGRGRDGTFDPECGFFTALRQCPVLAQALLIAEPWDAGPKGYQVGHFPGRFMEWNDRFRDAARGFWLVDDGGLGPGAGPGPGHSSRAPVTRAEFALRFDASPDLYAGTPSQRLPTASVNCIAVHDGATLADCVCYAAKHNHANGEGNRDGSDSELRANFGAEGPSDDTAIRETRRRVQRALLATLLLARGTPMLLAGDEFGNSQGGNNNAWNQDNATGWLGWGAAATVEGAALTDWVTALTAFRRDEPMLRDATWTAEGERVWHGGANETVPSTGASTSTSASTGTGTGRDADTDTDADTDADADAPSDAVTDRACLALQLRGTNGTRWLLAFNPMPQPAPLPVVPGHATGWCVHLDSSGELAPGTVLPSSPRHGASVPARSVLVLRPEPA